MTTAESTNYEAKIRADIASLSDAVVTAGEKKALLRKRLKAIGIELPAETFETSTFDVPLNSKSNPGKSFPMMKCGKGGKSTSGIAVKTIAENPVEFFQFAFENSDFYGIKFSAEAVAAIDLLTGQTSEDEQ